MSTAPALFPEIHPGGVADLDGVMTIMAAAFDPHYGEAWTRGQCEGVLRLSGVWLAIARIGGCSAGFALARSIFDEAELLLLAVAPASRRLGVGGALLETIMHDAAARGAGRIHLEMRCGNPAVHLYHGARFDEVGRRRRYYRGRDGTWFDAVTLSRGLSAPD